MAEEPELVFCKNCGNLMYPNAARYGSAYCENCGMIHSVSSPRQSFANQTLESWGMMVMNVGGWALIISTLMIVLAGAPIEWIFVPALFLLVVVFIGRVLWDIGVEFKHAED